MKCLSDKKVLRYLNMAKKASEYSNYKRFHLGAIAVYKGIVLAKGFNSYKTSPLQKEYNKIKNYDIEGCKSTLHAESCCLGKIKNLDIDFSKVTVFVYREHKDKTLALARPCISCRKLISDLGIHNVYYTTDNGWAYERIY